MTLRLLDVIINLSRKYLYNPDLEFIGNKTSPPSLLITNALEIYGGHSVWLIILCSHCFVIYTNFGFEGLKNILEIFIEFSGSRINPFDQIYMSGWKKMLRNSECNLFDEKSSFSASSTTWNRSSEQGCWTFSRLYHPRYILYCWFFKLSSYFHLNDHCICQRGRMAKKRGQTIRAFIEPSCAQTFYYVSSKRICLNDERIGWREKARHGRTNCSTRQVEAKHSLLNPGNRLCSILLCESIYSQNTHSDECVYHFKFTAALRACFSFWNVRF